MIATVFAYMRERVRPSVFMPATVLLTFAAIWTGRLDEPTPLSAGESLLLMAALVLQFRLFDDLEDRARDRAAHPDRVLARSDPRPFHALVAVLAIASGAIGFAAAGTRGLAIVVALDVAAALLYRAIRPALPTDLWPLVLVAVKYAALVATVATVVGAPSIERLLLGCLTTSAGACVFELTHTRRAQAGVRS